MAVNLLGGECDPEFLKYVKGLVYKENELWKVNEYFKTNIKTEEITYENYKNRNVPVTFSAQARVIPTKWILHCLGHRHALVVSKTKDDKYEFVGFASLGSEIFIYQATLKQKEQFLEIINK